MDLCYFLVSCALFTSVVAFTIPTGPFGSEKNVSLLKIVKRSVNDRIDFNKFSFVIPNEIRKFMSEKELQEAFRILDRNKDGLISTQQLQRFLTDLGLEFTYEELESMIQEANLDEDGFASYEDASSFIYCQNPGVISNGRVVHIPKKRPYDETEGKYVEGSRLQYSCDDEYTLEGSSSLTCQSTGSWSSRFPTCKRVLSTLVYCQHPGEISNGRVIQRKRPHDKMKNEYPERSRLQYSCDDGYTLEGSSTLFCLSTGRWSSRPPTCERVPDSSPLIYCQNPGDISNGWMVHVPSLDHNNRPYDETEDEYPEGSRIQYSCDEEYTLEGSSSLTCQSTGSWSSRSPTCERVPSTLIYCQHPGEISNGRVIQRMRPHDKVKDEFPERSRLQYSCDDGYTLEGSSTLFCGSTGRWSSRPPTCKRDVQTDIKFCVNPGLVLNGNAEYFPPPKNQEGDSMSDEYPVHSRLEFSCDDGLRLQGTRSVTCQSTGVWSGDIPSCVADVRTTNMFCEHPGFVSHGNARYFPPHMRNSEHPTLNKYPEHSRMEYSCEDEYRLQGPHSVTCQSTGHWSGTIPSCVQDCGHSLIQTSNRVANDTKTNSGEWPWVVSISVEHNGRESFICGGAVLNTQTVITAAHCLTGPFVSGRTLILRFGKHRFAVQDDDEEVLILRSSRVIVHPDYSNKTFDSDIGLVFLQHRIRYSPRVQPICLPTRYSSDLNIKPRSVGYVGGWGETEDAVSPDLMMLSRLLVFSNRQCMDAYKEKNLRLTSNMFCAGYEDARHSVCGGDSGSPFVFYDEKIQRYVLEGVVSFSEKGQCGVAGKYAIFTKVFSFLDWIVRLYKIRN